MRTFDQNINIILQKFVKYIHILQTIIILLILVTMAQHKYLDILEAYGKLM